MCFKLTCIRRCRFKCDDDRKLCVQCGHFFSRMSSAKENFRILLIYCSTIINHIRLTMGHNMHTKTRFMDEFNTAFITLIEFLASLKTKMNKFSMQCIQIGMEMTTNVH